MASRTIATILSMRDQFTAPARRATSSVRNMSRAMRRTQNQVRRFGREARTQFVNVAKDAGKMAIGITKAGTVLAGVTGGLALKTGFGEAINMEGFKTQLETATKDVQKAGEIMAWSVNLANKTPFETGSVVEMSAKFEAMGLSAKKWGTITADMAGATNKDVIQATEAIIDAQAGELERLKEFGLKKQDIVDKANEIFKGKEIVNQKGQIVDQEKFNEAMMQLMIEKYEGGAEKQSKTFKGMWSTVTGVTKNALAKIVGMNEDGTIRQGSLYEKLKGKIKVVADTLQKWQKDGTIDKIRGTVENAVSRISNLLGSALDLIKDIKAGFGSWDGVATPILEKIDELLYNTFGTEKADMISNVFHTAFDTIENILSNSKKLYEYIKKNWDTIAPIVLTIAGAIATYKVAMIASIAYTKIATAVQFVHTSVLAGGAATVNAITVAQWAWNAALTANPIGIVIAAIAALIAIGILVWKNWDTIKAKAFELWEGMKEAFEPVGEFFSNLWEGVSAGFKAFVNFFIDGINKVVKGINSINIKVPDWVPGLGGQQWGLNIPELPRYARGGIADQPSIFGDAGAEIAIPLKKNNPRSQQLLTQADTIINGSQSKKDVNVNIKIDTFIGTEEFANIVGDKIYQKTKLALANMA